MRLVTRVTTAGERGLVQMPRMKYAGGEYGDDHGILNEAKVRSELANNPCIIFSSNDNQAVLAFAVELMDRMRQSYSAMMEKNPDEIHIKEKSEKKDTCDRRMERGSIVYVRVDIATIDGAVRVSIAVQDPKETVGNTKEMATLIAQGFADNLIAIREDLKEQGAKVVFVEKENCYGIFARAEERNRMRELHIEFAGCTHRRGDYCAPINPSCPLYKDGKCTWR